MTEKKCTRCGTVKAIDNFAHNRSNADGYQCWCYTCFNIYRSGKREMVNAATKRWAKRYKEKNGITPGGMWARNNPIKRKAHRSAYKIEASACGICGSSQKVERHHPDYSKPDIVMILCHKCHLAAHGKQERVTQ